MHCGLASSGKVSVSTAPLGATPPQLAAFDHRPLTPPTNPAGSEPLQVKLAAAAELAANARTPTVSARTRTTRCSRTRTRDKSDARVISDLLQDPRIRTGPLYDGVSVALGRKRARE